ncbi:MAG: ABC transporter ATP-binding protein [Lachnospiraceae bacterium]|nr:ABC transporter ATP-binding protein [Lachnospiraceae bacterium]MBP3505245.1 ABC transporter ATP-binding protein [Lachnospiraceae bacterium]
MSEQIVIDVKNLTKQYRKQVAVNQASFQIKKGSICGLIGPNGAGKTTIMKMLGGLVIPTAGEMSIFQSKTIQEQAKARERMSFMIETPYAKQELTAQENLEKQRLQKGIPNRERIREVLELVGLSEVGNKKIKEFSLGMKQRFGIANALMGKPEIMVMDEPINGLDPEGIVEIRELLMKVNREEDITVLISSHILSELSLMCDDYLFIHHGEMIKHLTGQELMDECRNYLHIHTDRDELALAILQEQLNVTRYEVKEDGSIDLFERLEDVATVSRTLFENGVIPIELRTGGESLEEYYMSMIGGTEHVECN